MRDFWKKYKDEEGVVIIEATIVFPVMFFVLFFIIYIGNIYFEVAQMNDLAMRYSIKGAQCVADPMHYDMETNGIVPLDAEVNPYRYIFGEIPGGSIDDIEKNIEDEITSDINGRTVSFFKNMYPRLTSDPEAEYNNWVMYSTFSVEYSYEITLPIRFFGSDTVQIAELSSRAEVSVNDTAEFVRNVDMVIDLTENTSVGQKIESVFKKINEFISKFAKK